MNLSHQFRQHSLAIVSLFVALSALGYNTWRNEQTEQNRNIRQAGFEMLMHIAELQRITYLAHFESEEQANTPRRGSVEVLVLRDLAKLIPDPALKMRVETLFEVWTENWEQLGNDDDMAVASIDRAINELRQDILKALEKLD